MVMRCNCLGCQNMAKRLEKPKQNHCVPTESNDFNRQNEYECENCIAKPTNINERYQRDVNTSNLYRTFNIPERFESSCTLNGYGSQWRTFDPVFQTINSEYGWLPPNAHTVPHRYYPRSNEFSEALRLAGMYRNYSLNTMLDKSRV